MKLLLKLLVPLGLLASLAGLTTAEKDAKKSIKALHITGEGYHDYTNQKRIITEGISERIENVEWTIWHHKNPEEAKKQMVGDWAKDYDIVVYNICHARETDKAFVESVVKVHEEGVPAIALHCTMHSYHWNIPAEKDEIRAWNRLLGLYSKGHGPKAQITVTIADGKKDHPILKDLPDGWKTPQGELYNTQRIDTADVLAWGENGKAKEPQAVIWTHSSAKAKVFATTIGHHNETMETKEYLDLISNGFQWALRETGK